MLASESPIAFNAYVRPHATLDGHADSLLAKVGMAILSGPGDNQPSIVFHRHLQMMMVQIENQVGRGGDHYIWPHFQQYISRGCEIPSTRTYLQISMVL